MSRSGAAGFSLVETLVTLAVSSLLLVLLFSVWSGVQRSGFRLADRAVAASDAQVGADSVRLLLRGVRLPERGRSTTPFIGGPDQLTATATPARSTACPGVRPGSRLQLRIERSAGRARLVCAPEGTAETPLLDLGVGPAAFSYAIAGRPWTARLEARLPPSGPGAPAPPRPKLWVRLAADGLELIETIENPAAPQAPADAATS